MVLAARVAFAALLYLFLIRVAAIARGELRPSAEPGRSPASRARATPRARLLVVDGGEVLDSGSVVDVSDSLTIGRAPDVDLRLDDPLVSGRHARLWLRGNRWYLADLGSTNGTMLNGQEIDGDVPLEPGDLIAVGSVRLKLAR